MYNATELRQMLLSDNLIEIKKFRIHSEYTKVLPQDVMSVKMAAIRVSGGFTDETGKVKMSNAVYMFQVEPELFKQAITG